MRRSNLSSLFSVAFLTITLAVGAEGVLAHHSVPVNYLPYEEAPLRLTGIVKELLIRNPHSSIFIEVIEEDGTVAEWLVHWEDANVLRRRGAAVDQIVEGQQVTITARQHRLLPYVAFFRDASLPDGSVILGCGGGIYRGDRYYATCDETEAHYAPDTFE